ncbi:MAG: hypothetical protein F6K31_10385 [Symploca sp. SIO2G7]|nr:hypothetical protein [Symploca sp. SIO2G7]
MLPQLPQLPISASGASLDNDTFTLTCHQCPIPHSQCPIPHSPFPIPHSPFPVALLY